MWFLKPKKINGDAPVISADKKRSLPLMVRQYILLSRRWVV
jgi:hypothetical protein